MNATAAIGTRSDCRHVPRDRSARVNGIRIDAVGRSQLPGVVASFLECGASHVVNFIPAYPTVLARQHPSYARILETGDLNVPDGMPVAWALRLRGIPAQRLAGSDALSLLPAWGLDRDLTHYFLGGTREVDRALRVRLAARNPGIRIAGVESLPFRRLSADEVHEAADRVGSAGADLLWLGLGTPNQHVLAHELRRLEAAPVILCVGAAFDFASGLKDRAPLWMQHAGLEWLHRLASEPDRLWRRYLVGNPRFVAGVVSDYVRPNGHR